MNIRKKVIRSAVDKLLSDCGIRGPAVDVEAIARGLGLVISKDNHEDNVSGYLIRKTDTGSAIIGVNRAHAPARQRFTIAHELAHYLLHQGEIVHMDQGKQGITVNLRANRSEKTDPVTEREANLFAAELLMPAQFLEREPGVKDIDILNERDPRLAELARKYQVSKQALSIRLRQLELVEPF